MATRKRGTRRSRSTARRPRKYLGLFDDAESAHQFLANARAAALDLFRDRPAPAGAPTEIELGLDVIEIARASYDADRNPLHAWRAYLIARLAGLDPPHWVLTYFDCAARALSELSVARPSTDPAAAIAVALEMKTSGKDGKGGRGTVFTRFQDVPELLTVMSLHPILQEFNNKQGLAAEQLVKRMKLATTLARVDLTPHRAALKSLDPAQRAAYLEELAHRHARPTDRAPVSVSTALRRRRKYRAS